MTQPKAKIEPEVPEVVVPEVVAPDPKGPENYYGYGNARDYMRAKTEKEQNELVPVYLLKDQQNYKDDVIVLVNGRRWAIARGKQVMVPRMVQEQLQNSDRQNEIVSDMLAAATAADKNYGNL